MVSINSASDNRSAAADEKRSRAGAPPGLVDVEERSDLLDDSGQIDQIEGDALQLAVVSTALKPLQRGYSSGEQVRNQVVANTLVNLEPTITQ